MSPGSVVRVAGVQMDVQLGQVGANRTAMLGRLGDAAAGGARLVVFPECALTGYGFASRSEAWEYAEPISGPTIARFQAECARRDVHAVFGFLERAGERLFNACALVGPSGLVASYRKVHLPFLGVDQFVDPGDRPFAVHEAAGLRLGMHICYDGSFPETGRVLALAGADLLVLPTNWPTHSECAAEHMIPCRAMENTVYMMAVNRVGLESGFRYIGQSAIADPAGAILGRAGAETEEILYAEIDPARARQKRLVRVPGKHQINRFADRRPAFYEPIVAPNGRASNGSGR
jgi:predicted amidohydrolase